MFPRLKDKKFWTGVPPWVLIGSVAVLLPIFTFMTMENVNREKEFTIRLLLEKGAALIRAFEAGTRTGMSGMQRGSFQLQRLLTETAQQPDIAHLIVADADGTVVAASDLGQVGATYGKDLDLASVSRSKILQWRLVSKPGGARVFEVFRTFEPTGPLGGMMRRHPPGAEAPPDPPRIIFVGLDMTARRGGPPLGRGPRDRHGGGAAPDRVRRHHPAVAGPEPSGDPRDPLAHQSLLGPCGRKHADRARSDRRPRTDRRVQPGGRDLAPPARTRCGGARGSPDPAAGALAAGPDRGGAGDRHRNRDRLCTRRPPAGPAGNRRRHPERRKRSVRRAAFCCSRTSPRFARCAGRLGATSAWPPSAGSPPGWRTKSATH